MSANAACAAKMLHYTAPEQGRLDVEIYWSKLSRVGFTKVVAGRLKVERYSQKTVWGKSVVLMEVK